MRKKGLRSIEAYFDANFYLAAYPDVLSAGADPLEHYQIHGWREARRPVPWFDPSVYCARFPDLIVNGVDPFSHFITYGDPEAAILNGGLVHNTTFNNDQISEQEYPNNPIKIGPVKKEEIEATKDFFDEDYYLLKNPDVKGSHVDPLLHFLSVGWIEGRDPSPEFSVRYYLKNNKDIRNSRANPFVHFCRHGRFEKWRRSVGVREAEILELFDRNIVLKEAVKEAIALDPMVALPDGKQSVNIPDRRYKKLAEAARALRLALCHKNFKHVIFVPHIRMSGAARVASILAKSKANIFGASQVLVVCTDSSETEYQHWFGDQCEVIEIHSIIKELDEQHKIQCLYDILRGIDASAMYNVNSLLAWKLLEVYGRQLGQEFCIFTYVFTWDETINGAKVGYPIQWLRNTSSYHDVILTDNKKLAEHIRETFGYKNGGKCEVVNLYTPHSNQTISPTKNSVGPRRPVFLWAGRFDRQKRVDILKRIMDRMPNAEFHVYGKPILDKSELDENNCPPNCKLMGTYSELVDVVDSYDYSGFLYTSQWDGIPTILLDIGQIGLPIVAPNVGGISELISNGCGYLIEEFEDVEDYVANLWHVFRNPNEALARSENLKKHIIECFSAVEYENTLREVITRYVS